MDVPSLRRQTLRLVQRSRLLVLTPFVAGVITGCGLGLQGQFGLAEPNVAARGAAQADRGLVAGLAASQGSLLDPLAGMVEVRLDPVKGFEPSTVMVRPDSTITWTNLDDQPHALIVSRSDGAGALLQVAPEGSSDLHLNPASSSAPAVTALTFRSDSGASGRVVIVNT